MLYFENDYQEGMHPEILKKMLDTNMEQLSGYGSDKYTLSAIDKIKKLINNENADVILLSGGTQTNQFVIGNVLKSYEGVICASTGHINVHEAGAIESTGHKVIVLPEHEGKIDPDELNKYLKNFYSDENHVHAVYPGMVYISYPTEYGTLYSRDEIIKISDISHKYQIPLYLDGARLGYGLMSDKCDITIEELAKHVDIFYIGGTKVGAMLGEALVFTNVKLDNLVTRVKQNGALMAKGRILGIQFDTLFTNNLYFEISKNAINCANILKKGLIEKGYKLYIDSPTNQQFIILENKTYNELKNIVKCCYWCRYDDNYTVIRLCTSWATNIDDVYKLIDIM